MAGKIIAVRMSEEDLRRLDWLAEKAQSDRSKIVRLLIAHTYTCPLPEIKATIPREEKGEDAHDA